MLFSLLTLIIADHVIGNDLHLRSYQGSYPIGYICNYSQSNKRPFTNIVRDFVKSLGRANMDRYDFKRFVSLNPPSPPRTPECSTPSSTPTPTIASGEPESGKGRKAPPDSKT